MSRKAGYVSLLTVSFPSETRQVACSVLEVWRHIPIINLHYWESIHTYEKVRKEIQSWQQKEGNLRSSMSQHKKTSRLIWSHYVLLSFSLSSFVSVYSSRLSSVLGFPCASISRRRDKTMPYDDEEVDRLVVFPSKVVPGVNIIPLVCSLTFHTFCI